MGCGLCTGDIQITKRIKACNVFCPPFIVTQLYNLAENSCCLAEYGLGSSVLSTYELHLSEYLFIKFKTFPEFFRVVNMKSSICICGGKVQDEYWNKNYQIITLAQTFAVTERSNMSEGKCNMGICIVSDDSFMIIGGNNSRILSTTEMYSTTSNMWLPLASLNIARYGACACIFNQDYVYAFGGVTFEEDAEKKSRTIERLKVSKTGSKWVIVPIYISEWPGTIESGCFQRSYKEIIICGGYSEDECTDSTYIFDVETSKVVKSANMRTKDLFPAGFSYKTEMIVFAFGITGAIHSYNLLDDYWDITGSSRAVRYDTGTDIDKTNKGLKTDEPQSERNLIQY